MAGQLVQVPFGMHTAETRSGAIGLERVTNLYPQASPQNAKGPVALLPTPGLSSWTTVGDGPIRGMRLMGSDLFVVSGAELYAINTNKVATLVGPVAGVGYCHMIQNGTHVGIATSTTAYAADSSSIVSLTQSGLNGAAYQDGYGLFTQYGTQFLWITNLDDMTTISGTDFTSADALPDNVVSVISDHREVWVFKEKSTEIYYNSGASAFPFARSQVIERGCYASATPAKAENVVYWLADDLTVRRAGGYQPEQISPPWIDRLISNASSPSTAVGFTYDQSGHTFYCLLFSDLSLIYDATTGMWHDRKSPSLDRWRASCFEEAFGNKLVGDYSTGAIYSLDESVYTDNSTAITRTVTSAPVYMSGNRFATHEFVVDFEGGVGLTSGQGSDPQAMLEWSDDQGNTWSNERWVGMGKIGEYARRARWNRLGSSRERTYRLSVSDPVNVVIVGAHARVEPRAA